MIDFNKSFQTDELLIRPISLDDFDEMSELTSDPNMWQFFTSDLSEKDQLKQWINSAVNDTSRLALTIVHSTTSKIIGSTSIGNISVRDKRAEIGWTWFSKSYQGKGHNSAVKGILLKYLIEDCKFERVEFKTDVLNVPARKALEKMGLVEEGVLRSHTLMTKNRRRDTIFYSVLRNEWEALKTKNKWHY